MKTVIAFLIYLPLACYPQRGKTFVDSVEAIIDIKQNLIKIKDNFYLIQSPSTLPASNITLYAGSNHTILVDNQWAKLGPDIESMVASVTDKSITHTINTHFHFDHTNGNKYFGKKKVAIVAHKNLASRLASDQFISSTTGFNGKLFQRATDKHGLPSLIFNDSLQIRDENETITIAHFKGAHTDGDAIVHFKQANIFCTGDIFITYGIPFIDEDNGGDIYSTLETIDILLSAANSDTRFIPGHGPVCTIQELVAYKKLLAGYKDQVVALMMKGLSLEKIKAQVTIDKNIGGFRDELIPHIYRMVLKHETLK